jgi:hypothetical protein
MAPATRWVDQIQRLGTLLEPYRRRMNDISIFIKELKGRFAQWFNRHTPLALR